MRNHVDQTAVDRGVLAGDRLADALEAERPQAVTLVLLGTDGALDLGDLQLSHGLCSLVRCGGRACARRRFDRAEHARLDRRQHRLVAGVGKTIIT